MRFFKQSMALNGILFVILASLAVGCSKSRTDSAPEAVNADVSAPQSVSSTGAGKNQDSASGQGSVELTWDPNKQKNIAGYRLYYGGESGKYSDKIEVGNKTSQKVSGLSIGKTFYFTVTAYDTKGNESTYAKEIKVTVKK